MAADIVPLVRHVVTPLHDNEIVLNQESSRP